MQRSTAETDLFDVVVHPVVLHQMTDWERGYEAATFMFTTQTKILSAEKENDREPASSANTDFSHQQTSALTVVWGYVEQGATSRSVENIGILGWYLCVHASRVIRSGRTYTYSGGGSVGRDPISFALQTTSLGRPINK